MSVLPSLDFSFLTNLTKSDGVLVCGLRFSASIVWEEDFDEDPSTEMGSNVGGAADDSSIGATKNCVLSVAAFLNAGAA